MLLLARELTLSDTHKLYYLHCSLEDLGGVGRLNSLLQQGLQQQSAGGDGTPSSSRGGSILSAGLSPAPPATLRYGRA